MNADDSKYLRLAFHTNKSQWSFECESRTKTRPFQTRQARQYSIDLTLSAKKLTNLDWFLQNCSGENSGNGYGYVLWHFTSNLFDTTWLDLSRILYLEEHLVNRKHSGACRTLITLLGLSLLLSLLSVAMADHLPKPTGKVLLTISGDISVTNSNDGAQFDYDMLINIGLVDKNIATHWTSPDSIFTGVLARDIMALVGANGTWVRAVAANDYSVNLPLTDLTHFDTLLGLSQNGERMRLRNKGPLWLLYPNDSRPDESDSAINERMIWQLTSLQIH